VDDDEQMFERLKWTVLDEAPHHHNSGIVYYWVKRAFSDRPAEDLDPIVQRVLLELLDEGLIYFYWGDWDAVGDPEAPERPTRAEVEADLARGGEATAIRRTVWFTSTEAGDAQLVTIPKEARLDYEERQRLVEFNDRHPEYEQKLNEWVEASGRWLRHGGRRPKHPAEDYSDFPGNAE
jgi:hypothetical protein